MPVDIVQKKFVSSFLAFLKKQVNAQSLTADAQESVEVAMQCLESAFEVEEGADGNAEDCGTTNTSSAASEFDLFEFFQSVCIERNEKSLEMAENIKNEGNQLMKDGKYNEALVQYNRAITFNPKSAIFYCNRAAAYIRLSDNERAVTDCKSALLYNSSYAKAYGRLGVAYTNLGKFNEAQQSYAKAIELEPQNQDYRTNFEAARNAAIQLQLNVMPQLREGLNAMFSNPSLRNFFNSADIDVEQVQQMTQNPAVMTAVTQMFGELQNGTIGGGAAIGPGLVVSAMPPDMMQAFQSFASQLAGGGVDGNGGGSQPGNGSGNNEPPPSSSS